MLNLTIIIVCQWNSSSVEKLLKSRSLELFSSYFVCSLKLSMLYPYFLSSLLFLHPAISSTPSLFPFHSIIDFPTSSFSILAFLGLATQSLFFIEPGKELEHWIMNMINPTLNPAMRLQQGSTCNSKPYYRATNASWGWRITAQPAAM